MPIRLLEITVPEGQVEQLPELLKDVPALRISAVASGNGVRVVHVLVDAQHVEAVTDTLTQYFGARDDFQVVVLAVEATIPPLKQPDQDENAPGETTEPNRKDPQRISREELYEDITQASRITSIYLVMVAVSTVVATIGLIRGDVAIIIGAMVIAPLLGPNVALSLACALGDLGLLKRALQALGAGVIIAVVLAFTLGFLLHVDPSVPQIAARTSVDFADIVLALASGVAGTLAFTSSVPTVVVGVMVAVALLPPLAVFGLLAGGGHWVLALDAAMLFGTNMVGINLGAIVTFILQGVKPRTWWEKERAKRAMRLAAAIWIILLLLLSAMMWFRSMLAR
jgi:uncharacterized hydrophobic protein (TIGR00341 family)